MTNFLQLGVFYFFLLKDRVPAQSSVSNFLGDFWLVGFGVFWLVWFGFWGFCVGFFVCVWFLWFFWFCFLGVFLFGFWGVLFLFVCLFFISVVVEHPEM